MASPSKVSTKKEEFNRLPRSFKQLQYRRNDKILRTATSLDQLPSVLIPSNDRRLPLPPLVNFGYPVRIEKFQQLLERKLGGAPNILLGNPVGVLHHLQDEVFQYGVEFQAVCLDGTDSMFFLAVSSNWDPAPDDKELKRVVETLKDFLEVEEDPVWCLNAERYFWRNVRVNL